MESVLDIEYSPRTARSASPKPTISTPPPGSTLADLSPYLRYLQVFTKGVIAAPGSLRKRCIIFLLNANSRAIVATAREIDIMYGMIWLNCKPLRWNRSTLEC